MTLSVQQRPRVVLFSTYSLPLYEIACSFPALQLKGGEDLLKFRSYKLRNTDRHFMTLGSESMANIKKYSISAREDGGYTIIINTSKRLFMPITSEGFFPKIEKSYQIDLIGKGKDWKHRGHEGYFYSIKKMKSNYIKLDVGYAWIDKERKKLYLNIHFVEIPDKIISADINGLYKIK